MVSAWPEVLFTRDEQIEKDMDHLYEVIREVRNIRAVKGVKPGVLVDTIIIAGKKSRTIIESNEQIFK